MKPNPNPNPLVVALTAAALALSGCTGEKRPPQLPHTWAGHQKPCGDPGASAALAGSWLYEEDGYMTTLRLNEQGNGSYQWKDGQFITTCLDQQQWHGRWQQPANDREGQFEIELTRDMKEGEGRWWYTRIGDNREPTEQGGEFQLKRIERSDEKHRPKVRLRTSRNNR